MAIVFFWTDIFKGTVWSTLLSLHRKEKKKSLIKKKDVGVMSF